MLHIDKITIDGFITEKQKLEYSFAKNNVTVIYGINGSGKTTLLEILYAIFAQKENILLKNNVLKIKLEYCEDNQDDKKVLIIEKKEFIEDNRYYFSKNYEAYIEEIDSYIPFQESNLLNLSTLLLGIYRGVNREDKIVDERLFWKFFENNSSIKNFKENLQSGLNGEFEDLLNTISKDLYEYLNYADTKKSNKKEKYLAKKIDKELSHDFSFLKIETVEAFLNEKYEQTIKKTQIKIQKSLFDSVVALGKSKINNINEEKLFNDLKKSQDLILKALSDDNKDEFREQIQNIFNNDIEYLKKQEILIKIILFKILEKLKNETLIYKRLQLFINEFNSFINYNKRLYINSNGVGIKLDDRTTHSLSRLSSGERHLLSFLATILLLGETKDFILIDEPEISLDIEWQEKLIQTIEKLAPNSQIIITSHSSTIWGEYFDETIEIIPQKA